MTRTPSWLDAPEFRALHEARRAIASAGLPKLDEGGHGAAARRAAFWVLYELGQVLDQLAQSELGGEPVSCAVRIDHPRRDRVMINIALVPVVTRPCEGDAGDRLEDQATA